MNIRSIQLSTLLALSALATACAPAEVGVQEDELLAVSASRSASPSASSAGTASGTPSTAS